MTAFVDTLTYPDGPLPAALVLRRGTSASISGGTIVGSDADPGMLVEFMGATAQSGDYLCEAVVSSLGAAFGFVGVSACMGGDANQYSLEFKRDGETLTLSRQVAGGYLELAAPLRIITSAPTLPLVIGLRVTRLDVGGVRLRAYFGQGGVAGTTALIDLNDDDALLRDRKRGGVNQFFFDSATPSSSAITEYRLTDQAIVGSGLFYLRGSDSTYQPLSVLSL